MKKVVKYTLRVILGILLFIIVGLLGGYIFLNTSSGRRWMNEQVTDFLQQKLGSPVQIGDIEFDLPIGVSLHDVVLEDHHHQKMISFKLGKVQYIRFGGGLLVFGNIELSNLNFNLIHYKNEKESNFQLVLNKFETTDTSKGPQVILNNIVLNHANFHWDGQNDTASTEPGIDWGHIDIKDFNTHISYVHLGDEITALIRSMNLSERSGFKLEALRTNMLYSNTKMEYKNLYIKTPQSEVQDYVKFDYDNITKFSAFIDSVHFKGDFNRSTVSFKDIAYFTSALTNKTDAVKVYALKTDGKIADIHVRNFDVSFGDSSYASGSGSMNGIPNIDESFIDVRMRRSRTSRKELMRILPETQLPVELEKFGIVSLKGSFTGFINDFVAYGKAQTALGEVESDINLKLGKELKNSSYSGKIVLGDFNLGKLIATDFVGRITSNATIEGQGFTLDALRAKLNGTADRFDINGYSYTGISVNGEVSKKFFKGEMNSNDPNMNLSFRGAINYNPSLPELVGNIDVRHADLKAVHILDDSLTLHTRMNFNFWGLNPDSIQGSVHARESAFRMKGKTYAFDTLSMYSQIDSHGVHTIKLYSDIINANINGNFQPSKLPDFLRGLGGKYIDSGWVRKNASLVTGQDLNFDINFRDMEFLFRLIHQDLKVKDSGYVHGTLNSENSEVHLMGSLPGLKYKNFFAEDIKIYADSKNKELLVGLSAKSIFRKDSVFLRDFKLNSNARADSYNFTINTSDSDYTRSLHLNGDLNIKGTTGFLKLDSSRLIISDSVWNIHSKTIAIHKLDSFVDIPLLEFEHRNQRLKVVGKYSRHVDLPLRVIVEDLNLQTISNIVPQLNSFSGAINGQIIISGLNSKPVVEAGLFISPLLYQSDTLGIFGTTITFDNTQQKLTVEGTLKNYLSEDELINISGGIMLDAQQNTDLNVKFMESPVSIFAPFIPGISNLKGTASANMKITGKLSEPSINGKINFNKASFLLDYLQTTYHFSHEFAFSGKTIQVNHLDLKDENDHSAIMDGKVVINKLSDVQFDINSKLDNFQLLNTLLKDNNLYYGQAYGSGKVKIFGPLGNMHMFLQLSTEKGTQLFMPIGRENTYGGHDYITILDHKNRTVKKKDLSLTGLDLIMELNVTPDAHMQIIFDPRVGDVMEGNGHGNLRLEISTDGDFNIYGTYYIDKGSYRFTALDLPLKQFSVKEGSEVKFQGNPYDAELNVQAFYNVRTSLAPLMESTAATTPDAASANSRILNVQTLLDLKGSLFTPTIKLNFDIPELTLLSNYSSDIDNKLRSIKSDETELNKQVVSLLVLNRFIPVGLGFTGNPSTSSLTDLVNTQVNYWLSHYIPGLTVGVDYRGTGSSTYRASTDLFNSRLNISGTYDQNASRNATYNAEVNFKIKEDGSLLAKASSRSSNNPVLQNDNVNTYAIGVFSRKEFNSFKDFFKSKKRKEREAEQKKQKEKPQPETNPNPTAEETK